MRDEAWARALWHEQDKHEGDRQRLFTSVSHSIEATRVVYPGSFVDIAPSFVFGDVMYIDIDKRAAAFFGHRDVVTAIITEHGQSDPEWAFLPLDYTGDLPVEPESFDLLISLYAGPISHFCGHVVRPGGHVLANPSHGDVALLSEDSRFALTAAITSRQGEYTVRETDLERYLVPKRPPAPSRAETLASGRGVAYTRPAFAYLFRRIA